MDLRGLFLNRGNMSSKHGRSAKYPDVSKPHFWNSGRAPYPTGAAHVSLTAVVEAHQTCGAEATPTAGSPRSVVRWRSRPKDVRVPPREWPFRRRNSDVAQTNRTIAGDRQPLGNLESTVQKRAVVCVGHNPKRPRIPGSAEELRCQKRWKSMPLWRTPRIQLKRRPRH